MANEIYGNLKGIRNSVIEELKTFMISVWRAVSC